MDTEELPVVQSALLPDEIVEDDEPNAKPSCHDSGIDIRDTSIPPVPPPLPPVPAKKVSYFRY